MGRHKRGPGLGRRHFLRRNFRAAASIADAAAIAPVANICAYLKSSPNPHRVGRLPILDA